MRYLLCIVGGLWVVIGFGNIMMMPWRQANEASLILGLMFNIIFFVLLGLIVAGIGSLIGRK